MAEREPDMIEVEEVIDKRFNEEKGITEYKVVWVGFSKEKATWMPEEELWLLPELISAFEAKIELQEELNDGTASLKQNKVKKKETVCENIEDFDTKERESPNNDQNHPNNSKLHPESKIPSKNYPPTLLQEKPSKKISSLKETLQKVKEKTRPPPPPPPRDSRMLLSRDNNNKGFNNGASMNSTRAPPPPPPSTNPSKGLNYGGYKNESFYKSEKFDRNEKIERFERNERIEKKGSITQTFKHEDYKSDNYGVSRVPPPPPKTISNGIKYNKTINNFQVNNFEENNFELNRSQALETESKSKSYINYLNYQTPSSNITKNNKNNFNSYENFNGNGFGNPSKEFMEVSSKTGSKLPQEISYDNYGLNFLPPQEIPTEMEMEEEKCTYNYNIQEEPLPLSPQKYCYDQVAKESEIEVYSIITMENGENGYVYSVETNLGTLTMTREELFPKFAPQLVLFYEKFLTFEY